jgi:D-3-phosphoglycerate dehydrogenase
MPRPTILLAEAPFSAAAREVLAAVGEVVEFGSRERFLERLPEATAIVTGLEVHLRKDLLDRAPALEVIASRTSQLRHLDTGEARRRGIEVLSIDPQAPLLQDTSSTAEETLALMLALVRHLPWAFDALKRGQWERARYGGRELNGKVLGIIGFGRLGRMVAAYGAALGMRVIAHDPYAEVEPPAEAAGLDDLLARADVVSLHCTYDDSTRGMLRDAHLRRMKPGAVFVNTARGEIVDEAALLAALREGRLAGAAIDTLAGEAPDGAHLAGNPLVDYAREHENLLIVPHLGGATVEATERTQLHISRLLADHLRAR